MAVVFPRKNNPFWPLPADYPRLTKEGQKKARVNACRVGGRPDLDVARWAFFRETYLIPSGYQWYKNGYTPSPVSHYQWLHDWSKYPMLVHAAPRGTAKTTINMEDILSQIVSKTYWECALFLSTRNFAVDRLGRLMDQVENNPLIVDDFGKLKPPRGTGIWNRGSCMELTNGCRVTAIPITGASLGTRPSGLVVFDDVEKSDDLVQTPSDLRENFEAFFFNAIYPMSRSPGGTIPMRIIGTLYHRRMFIYWLYTTKDKRVRDFWKRTLMNIKDMDWDVMGEQWQQDMKQQMGAAAFSAQYMNAPTTDAERILDVHPELNTYWLEDVDQNATDDPINSQALVVSHQLGGYTGEGDNKRPIPSKIIRKWSDVLGGMRRFITVDTARTTTDTSDYSVVHCLGFENTHDHRDTLYSLDIWMGRVRYEELVRRLYQMAIKWQVPLIGVEAYPVFSEFYERVKDQLPSMFGGGRGVAPRVIPLKFPPHVEKVDKFLGMEWRFSQFRVKYPLHLKDTLAGYRRLWYETENFTEDMALLDHDDCLDTLAMHQCIGKQSRSKAPDVYKPANLVEKLDNGEAEYCGIPCMSGINASDIPPDVLDRLLNERREAAHEEYGLDDDYLGNPFECL